MACAILGGRRYYRYLIDKSDWVNLVLFSRYLEQGECFWHNYEWAAAIYSEGAEAGREVSALYLGYLYLKGLGVARDVKEARRWFDLGVLYQINANKSYQMMHTEWVMGHRGMPPELMDAIERGRKRLDGDGAEIRKIAQWLRTGTNGYTKNEEAAERLFDVARSARIRPHVSSKGWYQRKLQNYRNLLDNAYHTRDPKRREYDIYNALEGFYNEATLGRNGPSQKVIAEVFEAGKFVQRDLFVAYLFYRAAQNNGLDVANRIERIRPRLTAAQIAEAESDLRQKKIIKYDYRDIRTKKLPQHPSLY